MNDPAFNPTAELSNVGWSANIWKDGDSKDDFDWNTYFIISLIK